ncbi:MAG: hypothetical protein COA42_05865 [Alteromonadaceae bacterium]|nr:MAG: hypothetical protein COA42_05865 [Alteromonadaceae bacterium]
MNEAELAKLHKMWESFYEKAWAFRKGFFEDEIAEGERNPLRLIHLLDQRERFYTTRFGGVGKEELELTKRKDIPEGRISNIDFDPNGEWTVNDFSLLPTGVSAVDKGVFSSSYITHSSYMKCDKIAVLADLVMRHEFDAVIELGSGYSQNLFKLHYQGGPKIPYYGGEYTESGTECAKMLGALQEDMSLTNFRYDFNNPDYSAIGEHENVLVFTCHAIEQVQNLSAETLPSIAKIAKKVTCVHFEPFGYQLKQQVNEVDRNHQSMFAQRNWNQNLLKCLLNAQRKKEINLSFIGKNIMGSFDRGLNPTSIAVWDNDIAAQGQFKPNA